MNQGFFTNLPSEIIIDILSRLPARSIISCKLVCKSWLDLVETHEFVKSHLSKSVPGLVICQSLYDSEFYRIFEFEDGLDLERHDFHYSQVTKFDFPHIVCMQGSANGLLFFSDHKPEPCSLYVSNPITREYIEVRCPQEFSNSYSQVVTYGFGASKITSQHKVVRIFHDYVLNPETGKGEIIPEAECRVYTLGPGKWRRLAACAPLEYEEHNNGALVNGNLHWLVRDLKGCPWISCFNLETELFSTFSAPPLHSLGRSMNLFALGDCLCVCDNTSDDEIVIWLMKEYGVGKSWTKEFVFSKNPAFARESYEAAYPDFADECYAVCPIKFFKDGDILMAWEDFFLFYYSSKTKTTQKVDMFKLHSPDHVIEATLHTPSFLSLKSFGMENVSSF